MNLYCYFVSESNKAREKKRIIKRFICNGLSRVVWKLYLKSIGKQTMRIFAKWHEKK